MSGECDSCSEHTLECRCNQKENMSVALTVIVKNEHSKFYQDFDLDYIDLSQTNQELIDIVKGVIKEFGKPVDRVVIKTTMVWK